ncbi:hypothetical protein GCM10017673_36170 [Streptosporangium violaceochromogenes]|nr:hypothetical protein GCM10017673_36170 [Streptosporangium violaceochromogenes]
MSTGGEHKPYSYIVTTVCEGVTQVSVSFYTADLHLMVLGAEDGRPTLGLYGSEGQVTISTTGGGPVTPADVALAREIFQAAARYLAECERLCPTTAGPGNLRAADGLGAVTA